MDHGPSLVSPDHSFLKWARHEKPTLFGEHENSRNGNPTPAEYMATASGMFQDKIYRSFDCLFTPQLQFQCRDAVFGVDITMEMVSCVASVSQLVVYIASSSRKLERLCHEIRDGFAIYREEESNICLLLNILQRLSQRAIADAEPILPVLIAISGIACQVLYLLQPNKIFGINWTPITAHEKISAAFKSLDKKRTLLHLYLSQAHYDALKDLRDTIEVSSMSSRTPVDDGSGYPARRASQDSDTTGGERDTASPSAPKEEQTRGFKVTNSLDYLEKSFADNNAVRDDQW
jgi:hypothetical protein